MKNYWVSADHRTLAKLVIASRIPIVKNLKTIWRSHYETLDCAVLRALVRVFCQAMQLCRYICSQFETFQHWKHQSTMSTTITDAISKRIANSVGLEDLNHYQSGAIGRFNDFVRTNAFPAFQDLKINHLQDGKLYNMLLKFRVYLKQPSLKMANGKNYAASTLLKYFSAIIDLINKKFPPSDKRFRDGIYVNEACIKTHRSKLEKDLTNRDNTEEIDLDINDVLPLYKIIDSPFRALSDKSTDLKTICGQLMKEEYSPDTLPATFRFKLCLDAHNVGRTGEDYFQQFTSWEWDPMLKVTVLEWFMKKVSDKQVSTLCPDQEAFETCFFHSFGCAAIVDGILQRLDNVTPEESSFIFYHKQKNLSRQTMQRRKNQLLKAHIHKTQKSGMTISSVRRGMITTLGAHPQMTDQLKRAKTGHKNPDSTKHYNINTREASMYGMKVLAGYDDMHMEVVLPSFSVLVQEENLSYDQLQDIIDRLFTIDVNEFKKGKPLRPIMEVSLATIIKSYNTMRVQYNSQVGKVVMNELCSAVKAAGFARNKKDADRVLSTWSKKISDTCSASYKNALLKRHSELPSHLALERLMTENAELKGENSELKKQLNWCLAEQTKLTGLLTRLLQRTPALDAATESNGSTPPSSQSELPPHLLPQSSPPHPLPQSSPPHPLLQSSPPHPLPQSLPPHPLPQLFPPQPLPQSSPLQPLPQALPPQPRLPSHSSSPSEPQSATIRDNTDSIQMGRSGHPASTNEETTGSESPPKKKTKTTVPFASHFKQPPVAPMKKKSEDSIPIAAYLCGHQDIIKQLPEAASLVSLEQGQGKNSTHLQRSLRVLQLLWSEEDRLFLRAQNSNRVLLKRKMEEFGRHVLKVVKKAYIKRNMKRTRNDELTMLSLSRAVLKIQSSFPALNNKGKELAMEVLKEASNEVNRISMITFRA